MRNLGLVLAATLLATLVLAAPAAAEDPGKIELTARTEPAELAPGGSGVLVLEGKMGPKLHVYATNKGGQNALSWKPIPVDGVTYDTKGVTKSKHKEFTEPTFGDKYDAWKGTFQIRVPVTLSKDVKPGTEIGALVDYQACTDQMCFMPQKDNRVVTRLVFKASGAAPVAGPAAPAKDAKPQLPEPYEDDDVKVEVTLSKDGKAFQVTITPAIGNKIYGTGAMDGIPVGVKPIEDDGITWGTVSVPFSPGTPDPLTITVPFERTTAEMVEMVVSWQVCNDQGQCKPPVDTRMVVKFGAVREKVKPPPTPDEPGKQPEEPGKQPDEPGKQPDDKGVPKGDVVFPVVPDDDLKVKEENLIGTFYADHGLLVLGLIFLLGAGLAFTPCVLPIIPITVAVVTGGRSDLPKKRLVSLLSTYVLSMALTFGAFGVVAALAGTTMSAAFQLPGVIWGIGGLFLVLAFGMLGVIELQPPQWMTKLQGGAQQRGGSLLGAALLGCVMAFVASPCTGPFIVAMSVVLATTESVPLGFSMFFAMGLGMGAVLFAFGALNFALRPGPWMVWVRYGFGMLLFGGALYYVANSGLLMPPLLWIVVVVMSLLAGYLVQRHLVKAEGEQPKIAWNRGARVIAMFAIAGVLVGWLTAPPSLPENVDPELVAFQTLESVEQLEEIVADNVADGRGTVVDVWGTWCTYCKVWEAFLQSDDRLRHEFTKVARLKIDVSTDNQPELRDALGIPRNLAPFFVFIDAEGKIRRAADVDQWYGEEDKSREAMLERLRLILGEEFGAKEQGRPWRYKKGEVKEAAQMPK
ncbi:MAG: cytochrome c biogenesis protein CcdA [Planctomycetota bacterium]|nr:cytochrome c biogenesis protein CcdA [Planctomycetota bacterium]